jgi:hypothetical protein
MPRIAERYGKDPAKMPFDFSDVLAALAPRPLFINAPLHDENFEVSGVNDCIAAAQTVCDGVQNRGPSCGSTSEYWALVSAGRARAGLSVSRPLAEGAEKRRLRAWLMRVVDQAQVIASAIGRDWSDARRI